ncbi:hypothetical protein AVEN_156283-1 [Araneus ventricosus]|uniref:Uncharacterized protein n=1 Tax=Araneus ventricosus TaxID=182803 RepID=A0A4Y2UDW8_ARAVE|nr:hypothetical protein AVEN_156283-1 [Araneus ventricosus]
MEDCSVTPYIPNTKDSFLNQNAVPSREFYSNDSRQLCYAKQTYSYFNGDNPSGQMSQERMILNAKRSNKILEYPLDDVEPMDFEEGC